MKVFFEVRENGDDRAWVIRDASRDKMFLGKILETEDGRFFCY